MLAAVTKAGAQRTALVDGERVISYAALMTGVDRLAARLNRMGIRLGDRVALFLPNGFSFVIGYFATVALGAIVVPLSHTYRKTELRYLLETAGVSVLITSHALAAVAREGLSLLHDNVCRLLCVEDETAGAQPEEGFLNALHPRVSADAPAMYQFSSGSTGRPKRIARSHAKLLFELNGLIRTLQVTDRDRFLGVAPFSHVNGLMRSMLLSIRAGAALYTLPEFERHAVAAAIEKYRLSIFVGVPFMFIMLAKTNFLRRPDLSSLRLCISASASMPPRRNREFRERFGFYVRQLYGSTETGTISVNLDFDLEGSLESVGKPIAGVEVEIFDEGGSVMGADAPGELAIRTPAAIQKYDGSDETSQAAFRQGYFFSGDIGRRDRAGRLYLVGRKTFFINRGGYKVAPGEVEEILESHPAVEEAVVVGMPTSYGDERVKAVVVLREACAQEELVLFCRGKIADFKIPSLVEFREALPKTPTGKVRRALLI